MEIKKKENKIIRAGIFLASVLAILAVLSSPIFSYVLTILSDGSAAGNFTFTGNENKTLNISLPKNASVISAYLNFSGFQYNNAISNFTYLNWEDDAETPAGIVIKAKNTLKIEYITLWIYDSPLPLPNKTLIYSWNYSTSAHILLNTSNISYQGTFNGSYNLKTGISYFNMTFIEGNMYYIGFGINDSAASLTLTNRHGTDPVPISSYPYNNSDIEINCTTYGWSGLNAGCIYSDIFYFNTISYKIDFSQNPYLEVGSPDGIYEWYLPNAELHGINAILKKLNDTSTANNFTFTGNENQTVYLQIPKYASTNDAKLNVSGYLFNDFYSNESEYTLLCNGCVAGGLANVLNGNWGDYKEGDGEYIYINYTLSRNYYESLNISIKWRGSDIGGDALATCYNNSNAYMQFANQGTSIVTNSYNVPKTCFQNKNRLDLRFFNPTGDSILGRLYENNITANSNISNIYLAINNNQFFNYSGTFSQSNNRTNSFHSQINSYLSSCTADSNNICIVPIQAHSDTAGILQISDILANYTNISKTLNFASVLNNALNNSQCSGGITNDRNCTINLTAHSDTAGILQISDIQINFKTTPNVTLSFPQNNSVYNQIVNFTCNVTDDSPQKNMTLNIWNSLNSLVSTQVNSITGTTNSTNFNYTFIFSDTYKWSCHAYNNDSIPSNMPANRTLIIDLTNPVINQLYPSNNQYLNNGTKIGINCSITSNNLDTGFLYGNFTGTFALNQTKTPITSGDTNTFYVNLTQDGDYLWTCGANKTLASTITVGQQGNFTFIMDTIFPAATINKITTTAGSQTASINVSASDLHLSSCKYSIFNFSGQIDGLNNNVSVNCNTTFNAVVTEYGTYNATFYSVDLASNENSSTMQFITSPSAGSISGGGGGISSRIPIVSLKEIKNATKIYSSLEREVIYAEFYRMCSQKTGQSKCALNTNELNLVIIRLAERGIAVKSEDLIRFYKLFQNNELTQGSEYIDIIKKYDLIQSVVGELTVLEIRPPSVDSPYIIFKDKEGRAELSASLSSNKPIRSCDIISGNPNLRCIVSNTSIRVIYEVEKTDFLSKIIPTSINLITDAPIDRLESKKVNITFRVYNLGYPLILGIPFVVIFAVFMAFFILLIYFYFINKRIAFKPISNYLIKNLAINPRRHE